MSVLSPYCCPNCGQQDLWETPPATSLLCLRCFGIWHISPNWRALPVKSDPTPMVIFELAVSELDPNGNVIDAGVSL
jgi:hypothetical protein